MAQSFGTGATFGLTSETGMINDSLVYNYSQDNKVIRSGTGDTTGKTYYDERCEISMGGYLPTSSPISTTLAGEITLVTSITDFFKGSVGTKTIMESVTKTLSNEDYQRIEISAMHHPLIS
jgi:hypothetical protein